MLPQAADYVTAWVSGPTVDSWLLTHGVGMLMAAGFCRVVLYLFRPPPKSG